MVRRYDTLWTIAARHLRGDPAQRWHDIARLNPDRIDDEQQITVGTVLTLPADAKLDSAATTQVTVHPGDTLSVLAAENGIPDWHTAWQQNANRPEPGPSTYTDPDHIEPGWTLQLTTAAAAPPRTLAVQHSNVEPHREPTDRTRAAQPPIPSEPPATKPEPGTSAGSIAGVDPRSQSVGPASVMSPSKSGTRSDWAALFTGAGALLATGLLGRVIAARRAQARQRRPGHTIPATPTELIPADTRTPHPRQCRRSRPRHYRHGAARPVRGLHCPGRRHRA